jgi:site-specific DNA-methyltransferase (adenine-specific)
MNTELMFSSESPEWVTPQEFYDKLHNVFNFTLDPCCTPQNRKCEVFFTLENDGLNQHWHGHNVFVNPPYGRVISKWVEKCYKESNENTPIVLLIPSRTDTSYQHDYIFAHSKAICFIRGRLKFVENGVIKNSAPFPSQIALFGKYPNRNQYNTLSEFGKVFILTNNENFSNLLRKEEIY